MSTAEIPEGGPKRKRRVSDTDDHHVYRLLDAEGTVLRVGCTADLPHRIRQYRYEKAEWWPRVVRVEYETFSTKAVALATEKAWLRTLKPVGNQLVHPRITPGERTPEGQAAIEKAMIGCALGALFGDAFDGIDL